MLHPSINILILIREDNGGRAENARLEIAAPNCRTGKRGLENVGKGMYGKPNGVLRM